jgi:hypothetical protein
LLVLLVLVGAGSGVALWRLRKTVSRQRQLLDRLPQTAVTAFDHDLRVTYTGGAASGIEGQPDQAEPLLSQLPKVQREPLLNHFRAALRGEQRSFEYRSPRTGRDHWVRVVPVDDGKGAVTGGLAVALDVSDRRTGQADSLGRRTTVTAIADATRELARSCGASTSRSPTTRPTARRARS